MAARRTEGLDALTDKERELLRLIARGHDAKSAARRLDRSVHTINERLRDARRKLGAASSREAARRLLAAEEAAAPDAAPPAPPAAPPERRGDERMGADAASCPAETPLAPIRGARRPYVSPILIGGLTMTLVLALLALATLPPPPVPATDAPAAAAAGADEDGVIDVARRWLALVDQRRWAESYTATGVSFRALNTGAAWAAASEKVRVPLGAALSRTLLDRTSVPAPPQGYEVVRFRTRFAHRAEAIETVALGWEEAGWRVVGVTIG